MKFDSIICFAGGDWWYHNPHSYNHIMRILSSEKKILYINSLPVGGIKSGAGAFSKILNKLGSVMRYIRKVNSNLWVFTPVFIPLPGSAVIERANRMLLNIQIKFFIKSAHMTKPLIWVTNPYGNLFAGSTRYPVLYQIVDKVTEYRNAPSSVMTMDRQLCEKAAIIITPGREIFNEKAAQYGSKVHRIRHAVDYRHFSDMNHAKPADFPVTDKPVFTYWGSVDYKKVDYQLARYIKDNCRDFHFLFIGRVFDFPAGEFEHAENITFLGARNYEELPAYAARSAGFIIPWDPADKMNQHASPIKIREYLCSGKPAVTTYIPEFEEYRELIYISKSNKEFAENVRKAYNENNAQLMEQRRQFALSSSWEKVVYEIKDIVSSSA